MFILVPDLEGKALNVSPIIVLFSWRFVLENAVKLRKSPSISRVLRVLILKDYWILLGALPYLLIW